MTDSADLGSIPQTSGAAATDPPGNPPGNAAGNGATEGPLEVALAALGYDAFRPGQREAVETLLESNRLLLVAPTGGGKSLVYQLPATVLTGTTLVVSPLVSLMNDQVSALTERGVEATYLAATLDGDEIKKRMRDIAAGRYRIVYAAPERLAYGGFRGLLADVDCPLVAIDEAHCISEWGHDFRPEYLAIGQLLADLAPPRIMACTATATPVVRDEILERLGLPADTPQIVRGFARPNLALRAREVRHRRERDALVDATLAEAIEAPGKQRGCAIVYTPTRKAAEEEADRLGRGGWSTAAYHAGLSADVRTRAQQLFLDGNVEVVCATNAFGMGIDRPDVRAVVHLAPPGSVEAYYQEVGRAGRDDADAIGLMLIGSGDMALRRHLIESTPDAAPEAIQHRWNLFLELMRWAEGGSCRHDAILRYFDDEAETLAGCGRCDVCTTLGERVADEDEETTLIVRKALSAVARVHDRFGLQLAAKLLAGSKDSRLEWSGLEETKTFGALADRSEAWLVRLLRRCVTAGWVDFRGGQRPMVVLTDDGREVMQGRRPVRLVLPTDAAPLPSSGGSGTTAKKGPKPPPAELDETGRAVFEALRRFRLEEARREGVPPYVVASDRTLRDLAALRPRNLAELKLAHGIGPAKAERYGEALLGIVAEAAALEAPPADVPEASA